MEAKLRILLAEDDASLARVIQFKLERNGYDVTLAVNGMEALDLLRKRSFQLLITDVRMPELDGIELLTKAKELRPSIYVILITAHAAVRQAVDAMKSGAFDYLTKPFEDEALFAIIGNIERFIQLEAEREQLVSAYPQFNTTQSLIGKSNAFRSLLDTIARIAQTGANVLITGESGTGKEMVARSIHEQSPRASHSFIAVNCAAIPKDLLESELFGHVRGAFTGADRDRKGRFELADKGTLLLDEIGELAPEMQGKLLRVLQEGVVDPVGAEQGKKVDVRILAATNQNLLERVKNGKFREDLFYRLNVIPINVPSLRERREDIPLLAQYFLRKFSSESDTIDFSEDLLSALNEYPWPGNIRELENLIERLVTLRRTDTITIEDLPGEVARKPSYSTDASEHPDNSESLDAVQRRVIIEALEAEDWNQSRAALRLSVPRHVLLYRMKKFDIDKRRRS